MFANHKRTSREILDDKGSVSQVTLLAVGATAVGLALFGLKNFEVGGASAEVSMSAQSVVDQISLPATIDVVSVSGGSTAELLIDVDVSVFGQDVLPVGDITAVSERFGDTNIKLQTLKNPDDNTSELDASNADKNIKLSVVTADDGSQRLRIDVDPAAISASTENMQGQMQNVDTSGLISIFRSMTPDQGARVVAGMEQWNDENFKVDCAQEMTKAGMVRAGIAKSVATILQVSTPAVAEVISQEFPDNPEAVADAVALLNELTKPQNIEVHFTSDPNGPQPKEASETAIAFMNQPQVGEVELESYIGLNPDKIDSVTLTRAGAACEQSPDAKADLQAIINKWESTTVYNEDKIDNFAGAQ